MWDEHSVQSNGFWLCGCLWEQSEICVFVLCLLAQVSTAFTSVVTQAFALMSRDTHCLILFIHKLCVKLCPEVASKGSPTSMMTRTVQILNAFKCVVIVHFAGRLILCGGALICDTGVSAGAGLQGVLTIRPHVLLKSKQNCAEN